MKNRSHIIWPLVALLLLAVTMPLATFAGQATYIYDDLGRLSQVIDEQGNVATYTYDAVGNLLSITRNTGGVAAPALTSITPASAAVGSTVNVTLAGQNLSGAALSTDNPGISITNVKATATTITATFSISFLKAGPTVVTAGTGAGSANISFTVNASAPTLTSLSPTSGPPSRLVAMTGAGFSLVPAENLVRFNGVPATVMSATPTSMLTQVPAGSSIGPVTVTRSGLTSNGLLFTVTAPPGPAPTISGVTPNTGSANGGASVTITGSGLSADTKVFIGGVRTPTAVPLHLGAIQVTTPAGFTGPADVLVTNAAGDALLPRGFTYGGPSVTSISPARNATGVPLNASIQITFSDPVFTSSVTSETVTLLLGGVPVATIAMFLQDNTVVQLKPTSPSLLQANTIYQVRVSTDVLDTSGHSLPGPFISTFSTGSSSDSIGPTLTAVSPNMTVSDGFREPAPLNARMMLRFNDRLNEASLNSNTFFLNDLFHFAKVPARLNIGPDLFTATLTPLQLLVPNASYSLTATDIQDYAGNVLTGALLGNDSSFETVPSGIDITPPQVEIISPANGATGVPINAPVVIRFTEPIAAPTISAQTLTVNHGPNLISGTMTFEQGHRVVRWKPSSGFLPGNATLTVTLTTGILDVAGNPLAAQITGSFTTGSVTDTVRPTVVSVSPANGAANVSRTTSIDVTFSEPINPATLRVSVGNNRVTFRLDGGGAFGIPGSFAISADRRTATFTPSFPLFADQAYFVLVSDNESCCESIRLEDVAGNKVLPFQTSFTTELAPGTDPSALPTAATVVLASPIEIFTPPAIFADGVATATVTIGNIHRNGIAVPDGTLIAVSTEPVFNHLFGNSSNTSVGGAILGGVPSADPRFRLFPTVGASVTVTYQPPKIFSNPFLLSLFLPTAAIQAMSVDAEGSPVGLIGAATVVLVADKFANIKTNPTTVLANGTSVVDVTVTVDDFNSANVPVPPGYQIAVTAAPVFNSSQISAGGLINGGIEAADPRFKLFTTEIGGELKFTYTPPSFVAGQTGVVDIQVANIDQTGNIQQEIGVKRITLNGSTGFTSSQPEVLSISPANGQNAVGTNTTVTVQFSQPLDPASVTAATFSISGLAGTRTFSASDRGPNTVVTFRPSAAFAAKTVFNVSISTGIKSAAGNPLLASTFTTFMTGAGTDMTAPAVTRVSPPHGATDVPTNAIVSVEFSEPLNAVTVTNSTVALSAGGAPVAGRLTLGRGGGGPNSVATFVAMQPLAAGTLYTVTIADGMADVAGNSLAPFSTSFTTASGTDFVPPRVVGTSPFTDQTNVPLSAKVTVRFSEPINPVTVNGNTFTVSQRNPVPGSIAVSADLLTATFTSSQPLLPNESYGVTLFGIRDLAGNPLLLVQGNQSVHDFIIWFFSTGTQLTDTAGPAVQAVVPAPGASAVARNAPVVIRLSEPVEVASVHSQSVKLSAGGAPVSTVLNIEQNNTVIRIKPVNLMPLQANTVYDVSVTGVTDVAGNPVAAFTSTFTTGGSVDQTAPTIVSVSPANEATNVPRSTAIMVTFSEPINSLSATVRTAANPSGGVSLTGADADSPFPGTLSFSADQKTMTFTPSAPLFADQMYFFMLELASCCVGGSQIEDLAGNRTDVAAFSFTTALAPGTDTAALPTAATVTANPMRMFADGKSVSVVTISNINRGGVIVPDGTMAAVTADPAYRLLVSGPFPTPTPGGTILDGTASATDPRFKLFATTGGQITVSFQAPALSLRPGATTSGLIQVASVDAEDAPSKLIGLGGVELVGSTTARLTANPVNLLANGTSLSAISIRVENLGICCSPIRRPVPPGTRIGVTAEPVYDLTSAGGVINGGDPAPDSRFRLFSTFGVGNVELTYTPPVLSASQMAKTVIQVVQVDGAGNVTGFLGSTPINLSGSTGFTAPQPTLLGHDQRLLAQSLGGAVSPPNGFSGAPTNTKVQAQFSQTLDPATVNSDTFTVRIGATPVMGSFTLGTSDRGPNTLVTFTPSNPLPPNSSVAVAVTTGIKSQTGNPLLDSKFSSFTTGVAGDTTAPTILTVNPSDGQSGAPTTTVLTVDFSEPVSQATIHGHNLTVSTGGTSVSGGWSLDNGSKGPSSRAFFVPDQFLAPNTQYTLGVGTGVLDFAGNGLSAGATVTFSTGTGADIQQPSVVSVSPASGATNVPTTTAITITFSEPMNPSSFNTTNLKMGGAFPIGPVPFTASFSNNNTVLILTPLNPLLAGNSYTVTVGIKTTGPVPTDAANNPLIAPTDIAGNQMIALFNSSFTTGLAPGTANLPDSAAVSASPTSFVANGLTSSTITISNVRRSGALAPDGTRIAVTAAPVSESTTIGGTISGAGSSAAPDPRFRIFTTAGGAATALYTPPDQAGTQPFSIRTGLVQVFSVDAANQPVAFIGFVSTSLMGVSSTTMNANPATLPANGTSTATVTVTVRDRNGALVPDGTRVGLTAAPIFNQTSAGGTIVNGTASPTDPRVQIFTTTGGQFTATYRSPTSRGSGAAAVQAVTVDPQGHPTYLINSVTITLQ